MGPVSVQDLGEHPLSMQWQYCPLSDGKNYIIEKDEIEYFFSKKLSYCCFFPLKIRAKKIVTVAFELVFGKNSQIDISFLEIYSRDVFLEIFLIANQRGFFSVSVPKQKRDLVVGFEDQHESKVWHEDCHLLNLFQRGS